MTKPFNSVVSPFIDSRALDSTFQHPVALKSRPTICGTPVARGPTRATPARILLKTSISMVCSETEVGKVGPMSVAGSSYSTSLHSICACPGRCLLDAKEDAGIRFDSSNVGGSGLSVGAIMGIAIAGVIFLIVLLFAIFICCLRRKLPSGIPKPSVCTTVKVGLGRNSVLVTHPTTPTPHPLNPEE
ncbi:hypothetical protein AWC38_SpisGene1282 [Stylophora pistillata]|uniref:Uncharacterized protein n=1 Tax=Stylophora pistillata TaxID=50429 RepID=A0A2B4SZN6_STYPI|nr:hypothetical protein AWC38_SpisGene1282 [Stylophora pistillata]